MEPKEEPNDDKRCIPHNNQITDFAHILPKEPKEEPLDISTALFPREISNDSLPLKMEPKEEPIDDLYPEYPVDNQDAAQPIVENLPADRRPIKDEIVNDSYGNELSSNLAKERDVTSPRPISYPKFKYSMDDSDEEEPTMKKTRLDSDKLVGVTIRESVNLSDSEDDSPESVDRQLIYKRSDTDMECIECEFRTKTVGSWTNHLRRAHSTTTILAGLILRCECGHECASQHHSSTCPISNFIVIRKNNNPIRRINDATYSQVKCILCEAYPKTLLGYAHHLVKYHKERSSLKANGIYLKCNCGLEVRSIDTQRHSEADCDGYRFTVHKLEDEVPSTPKCVLCESYPKTPGGYVHHLTTRHKDKSTLNANGLYLICACGQKIHSASKAYAQSHNKECDGSQFTLHELKDDVPSTPQCIMCEFHPKTPFAYISHLKGNHRDISTLAANGIYLRCACGTKIYSKSSQSKHGRKCNGLQFTLHKIGE